MTWSEATRTKKKNRNFLNKFRHFYAHFLAINLKTMDNNCDQEFLNEELKYVREKLTELVEGTELIACHLALVQVKIK